MHKKFLVAIIALSFGACLAPAAMAAPNNNQNLGFGWQDAAPVNGAVGDIKNTSGKTDTVRFYQQADNGANQITGQEDTRVKSPLHKTGFTEHGGIQDQLQDLPDVTSGSVLPGGGQISPGSLAYMVEHHTGVGGKLPNTTLDSFVARSGYNDFIYGDEGTDGPPPYSSFGVIQDGGVSATTGHQDGSLPSAWY